ncbi:hypothetical protein G7Y89_g14270 [Cudoniella acicularis]|uniref:Uncharacterized protein n=1 Tax=Cudoniella acicularis TaxID=354080 RepID=A0A8H4R5G5_9HELO|nr:hypothetical protein G7Y89_g14270 [Cudoniella acicularis]
MIYIDDILAFEGHRDLEEAAKAVIIRGEKIVTGLKEYSALDIELEKSEFIIFKRRKVDYISTDEYTDILEPPVYNGETVRDERHEYFWYGPKRWVRRTRYLRLSMGEPAPFFIDITDGVLKPVICEPTELARFQANKVPIASPSGSTDGPLASEEAKQTLISLVRKLTSSLTPADIQLILDNLPTRGYNPETPNWDIIGHIGVTSAMYTAAANRLGAQLEANWAGSLSLMCELDGCLSSIVSLDGQEVSEDRTAEVEKS